MAGREVRVAILGDSRDFQRAVRDASNDAGRLGGAFGRIGRAAATMGRAVAIAGAAAAVAIGKLAVDAISSASDLEESLSKSNTVFGESAREIEEWSRTAATSFGQSQRQALDAAGAFGNMFVQLGIGSTEAAQMSRRMVELASDFASFHNADISEVLTAQAAAFRGEYDAVQRFVPTINAAAVEQKALEMGLADTTKELDAQDKALAVNALLFDEAGDAVGDFARTSDGLANKQRILAARFEDVKARIGRGLMPVAIKLFDFFERNALPIIEEIGGGIAAFARAFNNAEDGITSSGLAGYLEGFGITVRGVWDGIGEAIGAFIQAFTDADTDVRSSGLLGYVEGLGETSQQVFEWLQTNVPPAFEAVRGAMESVASFIQDTALPAVRSLFSFLADNEYILIGVAATIGTVLVAAFLSWAASAAAAAAATIVATAPVWLLALAIGALIGALAYAYFKWEGFRNAVDSSAEALRNAWPWISKVGEALAVAFIAPIRFAVLLKDAIDDIAGAIHAAIDAAGRLVSAVKNIPSMPGIPGFGGGGVPFVPWFDSGGVMPGPRGVHSLAMVAGGETIVPTHKPGVGGGGNTYNVNVYAWDTRDGGRAAVEAIKQYERSNGTGWRSGGG